jgi:uncharacterized protein (PEP-CTERM system associated)
MPPARATRQAALLLLLLGPVDASLAQERGERTPVWRFGASATVSATDNARATSLDQQSGVAVEGGLDVHLHLPYRRVRGFVDYSLVGIASHVDDTTYRNQHELQGGLNAEIVESHAFLDASASYARQLGSVFGSPQRSLQADNDNQLDTANLTVSPVLRWRLGQGGRGEARLTDSMTRVKDSTAGDIHSRAGGLIVESGVRPRSSTWRGQVYGAIYDPEEGRRTTEALARADVGWAFDADTVLSLVAGREGNDFDSTRRVYNDLYGLGLDYRPNQRTRFYAEALHRFFGTGHTASLSYRLPQFALIAASSRTNSRPGIGLSDPTAFESGSAFDVLFLQLASVEPDVDRRRILVQDLLSANGIDPNQPVNPRLLTSGVLLTETHSISTVWTGSRNTLTLLVSKGSSRRIDTLVDLPASDQFRTEDSIDQRGVQVIWLRRLTPVDDLSVSLSHTTAKGNLTQLRSTSQFGQLRWARRIGNRSTLAATASHERFDETAVTNYRVNVVSCEYRILF